MTLENLDKLLTELQEDDRIKIVEGKRDQQALEAFGIKNIRKIKGRLSTFMSRIKEEAMDVIVLTDHDTRGNQLAERLKELAHHEGIKADLGYRKKLRMLSGVLEFEDLVSHYEEIKRKESKKTR
ncbi:MAG: toprim domain-containing protein [DPANN group archaeon]|nr:toprim domain-containing protein [DPANN group archaeon]